ncbi:MAG: succinate--CoA ligase subunit alpha [Anaerolineae bacterium]|jgi:succinyl-CoA synthetase alpha subunit
MSILIDKNTRLIVQGITGREGEFHTRQMQEYGTNVVAGVTPGKGGGWVAGIPVFDTVREAVNATEANTSIIYVPARFAPDAIIEAVDAGIDVIVCITEGIPVLDMIKVRAYLDCSDTRLIGPNCPGLITPGEAKVGIMPGHIHTPGPIGVVSRSGTLTYEVVYALSERGLGQSTAIGIGGDPVIGTDFIDALKLFEADRQTSQIVLIGEIGGTDEQRAADYIARNMSKPVTAFVAGQTAPPGKRMGHAGAIIQGGEGTAEEKIAAFEAVGVRVARHPEEIADLVAELA